MGIPYFVLLRDHYKQTVTNTRITVLSSKDTMCWIPSTPRGARKHLPTLCYRKVKLRNVNVPERWICCKYPTPNPQLVVHITLLRQKILGWQSIMFQLLLKQNLIKSGCQINVRIASAQFALQSMKLFWERVEVGVYSSFLWIEGRLEHSMSCFFFFFFFLQISFFFF